MSTQHKSQPADKLQQGWLSGKAKEAAFSGLVTTLKEQQFKGRQWPEIDKAFACAWLSGQHVAVGTKCNKLLLLDVGLKAVKGGPTCQVVALPRVNPRPPLSAPALHSRGPFSVQNALWSVAMLLGNAIEGGIASQEEWESEEENEGEGGSEEDAEDGVSQSGEDMIAGSPSQQGATEGVGPPQGLQGVLHPAPASSGSLGQGFDVGHGGVQTANCGMHCISLSPCRKLLACGGAHPNDCQTFKVEERRDGSLHLTPAQTLVGHKDWIFSAAWITDRHLVTGSRDTCLKLWTVDPEDKAVNALPLRVQPGDNGKVRDVKYLDRQQRVASLAVNGNVQIWDAHLDPISSVATEQEREVVCMAATDSLLAVGSRNHVSFVDPRQATYLSSIATVDQNQGVRSLAFSHHLLSVGGGQGKIHFYDLRAGRYLEAREDPFRGDRGLGGWQSPTPQCKPAKPFCLETGEGHLARNEIYREHFEGVDVKNACYAHAWDPMATRLLSVGGPLAFGLSGTYAAIWE